MTFDTQTMLLIGGVILALLILVWLLLRAVNRRQALRRDEQARVEKRTDDPYAVSKERPYMAPPPQAGPTLATPPPPPPAVEAGEGRALRGEEEDEDEIGVSQPAVPLPGELAGIAFPPHSTDHPDPLTRLKGVGPKLEALLNEHGITRYEQLASLDERELAALEERLGAFKGRLTRDRVVEQARLLASGATAEYEEKFGKLGGQA